LTGYVHREWTDKQIKSSETCNVAVMYASAYGNTASLAQAISRGVTKAGPQFNETVASAQTMAERRRITQGWNSNLEVPIYPVAQASGLLWNKGDFYSKVEMHFKGGKAFKGGIVLKVEIGILIVRCTQRNWNFFSQVNITPLKGLGFHRW
jgi:hypothetical protein